jgi:ABC-2 type transport system permease protein
MSALAGTRALLRLALRLDRVWLSVWIVILAITPAATAAQYKQIYPDAKSLEGVSAVISNPSLVAVNGPLFQVSLGGLTAWKIGATEFILVALMSILTLIRHTRTEEESGRLELLGATVVGRYAPLTAALACVALGNLGVVVLVALFLAATGLPVTGAVAFGLATGLVGMAFGAIAALTAQLTDSARSASAMAIGVLGAAYLLRALGDTGPIWVTWISPIGWAMRIRAYAGEQWWVLALPLLLTLALSTVAYALVSRRDLGAGLLPQRPGPAVAAASLSTAFGLAWRLQRGLLLGWFIAMVLSGALLGGVADSINGAIVNNQQLNDYLARLGGAKGLTDEYLAAVYGIVGVVAACYTVQATLRMRGEETGNRLESVLATRVGRVQWALSHVVFALLGTAVLLAAAGVAGGLSYGSQIGDIGGQVSSLLAAAMVQLPATWVLAGLGLALFGLAPRLCGLTWAALVACALLFDLGALLGLSQWVIDVSPFTHVPKLPGSTFSVTGLLWLVVVTVVLGAGGLIGFRRRNIG